MSVFKTARNVKQTKSFEYPPAGNKHKKNNPTLDIEFDSDE